MWVGSGQGRREGEGSGDVCYSTCTVHGVYRSKLTYNPLLPSPPPSPLPPPRHPAAADRKRVNLSGPEWWVGKSCPVRVIQSNYPPSVFANNGLMPPPTPPRPLFFCPAWSLCLHGKAAFDGSIALDCDRFPGGHLGLRADLA